MSDRMILKSLKRYIIHLAHLTINKNVRQITKMTYVMRQIFLISVDAKFNQEKEAKLKNKIVLKITLVLLHQTVYLCTQCVVELSSINR